MDTDPRRRIYYNVPFNPNELQTISEVRIDLQHHNIREKYAPMDVGSVTK
jgi:hypothetical protein